MRGLHRARLIIFGAYGLIILRPSRSLIFLSFIFVIFIIECGHERLLEQVLNFKTTKIERQDEYGQRIMHTGVNNLQKELSQRF